MSWTRPKPIGTGLYSTGTNAVEWWSERDASRCDVILAAATLKWRRRYLNLAKTVIFKEALWRFFLKHAKSKQRVKGTNFTQDALNTFVRLHNVVKSPKYIVPSSIR